MIGQTNAGSLQAVAYNKEQNLTDLQKQQARENIDAPSTDGHFPDMTVGDAEHSTYADFADQISTDRQIEDADEACPPIVFGTVGGNTEVQDGLMKFPEVHGNTIKWNQLVQNGNFASTDNWSTAGASLSVSNNVGTIANTNGYRYARAQTIVPRISGHKYFVTLTAKDNSGTGNKLLVNWYQSGDSGSADGLVYETLSSSWKLFSTIFLSSHTSDNSCVNIYPNNDDSTVIGDAIDVKNVMVLDLTAIYGAGNEPSTVAEFVRDFPLPYYAYNVGTLLSSKSSSVDFIKRNQWDEEWEVGTIDNTTGQDSPASNRIRSKNYIPVLQSTVYFAVTGGDYYMYPYFYDGGKNYIGVTSVKNGTITVPANAAYMRFIMQNTYGTTYNNDICIYINWDTPNLPYVKYQSQEVELPNIELRSVGDVYDVLYQQGGGKRRVGERAYQSGDENDPDVLTDGTTTLYVLETEIDITTTENPGWDEYIEIDNFGTIKFSQDPAQDIPVPQEYFIEYTVNLVEFLDSAYVRTGGDANKIALLEDIVIPDAPTTDGTYTLKVVVSAGVPTYSWVADA